MTKLNPYLITIAGKDRMIQAQTLGAAVMLASDGSISQAKLATGPEVIGFLSKGGTMESTEKPIDATKLELGKGAVEGIGKSAGQILAGAAGTVQNDKSDEDK